MHTLSLSTRASGQGRLPLLLSQRALGVGATLVFGAAPPLHYKDPLRASQLLKEDMHNGITMCLCWKESITYVW